MRGSLIICHLSSTSFRHTGEEEGEGATQEAEEGAEVGGWEEEEAEATEVQGSQSWGQAKVAGERAGRGEGGQPSPGDEEEGEEESGEGKARGEGGRGAWS